MDSWPRVALLVDVAAAAELCERLDDSLLGCLQLVRELQSESGGRDVGFSFSLFDSSRDLDQRQLQAFTRQQSYCAHSHHQHARIKGDVVCMSSWQSWDTSAWSKFRKNVLAAVSLCGKDMASIASPVKRAVGHDENRANGGCDAAPELPLICRCLSAVNTSGCKSNLYICVVGMFPSVDHIWREWAGIPQPMESVSAELITAQLSSHVQHTEPQWRFVECRPQSGVQAVLQASSTHGAVQLFASSATAKGLLYDQLCARCFVSPPAAKPQPASVATTTTTGSSKTAHANLHLSLNGHPEFACRGDWRPIRRKTALQRLVTHSTVDASKLEHCCPQSLGRLLLDGAQLGTPMMSWVGTLHAAKLAAVGVAVCDGSELPVCLLPVSPAELQVALIRVGSGQTPLLINAIKQSTVFASNSTLLSLMRPPPHVVASLATTTKRAPLQPQPQLQQSDSKTLKPRMSRGSSLLRRSDSVVSAADCDRSFLEVAEDGDETLQAVDAALNAGVEAGETGEEPRAAAVSGGSLNLLEDADFARDLRSHVQTRLQDEVWATCADAVESCILRGQLHPLELAQTLATQAPMDKAAVRRVAEAILSLYEPIAKKFMGRCTVAERALLARCSILQLLFLFESALAGKKPGKGKAQGMELSKLARRYASHAIVKLATNLNAPGFEHAKMLFAGTTTSSSAVEVDFVSVRSVCSYLQQRYGDKLRAAVEEICSEVDDSYSKPRADLPSKLAEQPAVNGRPFKLRLLPEGGEDSGDDDNRQSGTIGGLPPFLMDDVDTRDSHCCSVLPAGSDTNMSDSISKVRKRLFEDAAPQTAPQTEVRSRRSYPPSSRSKMPVVAADATFGQEPVKLQELISRSTVAARGGFAASRQQVGAYQVVMAPKAAVQQSKLKRSHSVPARGRELLARSQATAAAQIVQQSPSVESQQPSTVAETPLIKRRRS